MELLLLAFLIVIAIFLKGFRKKSAPKPDAAKTESLLLKHKELFDRLFPNPLTREQRLSIVDDSRRTLVIASAGSGKTTTLLGKYAFLPPGDGYANSEERRVMYVAMPRAREKVFLVSQSVQPSSFTVEVKEICRRLGIKFNDIVLRGDIVGPCPKCLSKGLVEGRWRGVLVRRVRGNPPPYSIFLGCTNFGRGLCNYTGNEVPCPACLTKGEIARLSVRFNESLQKHEVFCTGCDYHKDYNSFRSNSAEK